MSINYYLLGINDAKEGKPAKNGMPNDYYRGYSQGLTNQKKSERVV